MKQSGIGLVLLAMLTVGPVQAQYSNPSNFGQNRPGGYWSPAAMAIRQQMIKGAIKRQPLRKRVRGGRKRPPHR